MQVKVNGLVHQALSAHDQSYWLMTAASSPLDCAILRFVFLVSQTWANFRGRASV